jgi:hypothetical protein
MTRLLAALLALAPLAAAAEPGTPAGRAVEAYLARAEPAPFALATEMGLEPPAAREELKPLPPPQDAWLFAAAEAGGYAWASLRLDVWFPAIDGTASDDNGGQLDVSEDLGLESNEATVVPRAFLSLGGISLILDGYLFTAEGNSTLTRTFTLGGVTFQVNEDVVSEVRLENLRGIMSISVIGTSFLRVSLLGGISYYDVNLTVTSQTAGTGTVTAPVPVPIIGVLGQARIGHFLFEFEMSGLSVDYADINVNYLDLQASVGFMLFKVLAVRAGYRYVLLDGTVDTIDIDATIDGFFVGGTVNF